MKNVKYAFLVLFLSQFQYAISCDSDNLEGKNAALRRAIYLTSYNNNTDAVKALLDEGANPSSQDTDGKTALHLAAEKGNIAITETLLAAGAPLDIQDNDGNTPLHSATKKLFNADGHIYPRPDPNVQNPPYHAIIENMVQKGADVNIQNNTGHTPLYIAVLYADYTAVKILLKATKLDLNITKDGGLNPLARSIVNGHDAYSFSAPDDNYKLIPQLLLDHGANPNPKDADFPPLSIAAMYCNVEAVKALLNANANPNTADKDGRIPLYAALRMPCFYKKNASAQEYAKCFSALLPYALYKKDGHLLCAAQPDKGKHGIINILNAFESKELTQEERKIRSAYPCLLHNQHIPFLDALNEVMNAQVATLPNHKKA